MSRRARRLEREEGLLAGEGGFWGKKGRGRRERERKGKEGIPVCD